MLCTSMVKAMKWRESTHEQLYLLSLTVQKKKKGSSKYQKPQPGLLSVTGGRTISVLLYMAPLACESLMSPERGTFGDLTLDESREHVFLTLQVLHTFYLLSLSPFFPVGACQTTLQRTLT